MGYLGIRYDNRNYSVNSRGIDSCCIDLLVCRGADKHIRASIETAREFPKKISFTDSNPTAAYDGLCVQSFFNYDVFLITNQRAISFALTAFFICTLFLGAFCMSILGRNTRAPSLFLRRPYYLSYPFSKLYFFREANVGKFAEHMGQSPRLVEHKNRKLCRNIHNITY